jgi:hypothetical protein
MVLAELIAARSHSVKKPMLGTVTLLRAPAWFAWFCKTGAMIEKGSRCFMGYSGGAR